MAISGKLEIFQERLVVSIFRHAASKILIYKNLIENRGIDVNRVNSIRDFTEHAPILNKDELYIKNLDAVNNITSPNAINECGAIFPSSGFSGKFSFGLIGKGDTTREGKNLYTELDYIIGVSTKKTLLINALSMGIAVSIPKVVSVNTGLRSDIVVSIIKTFSKNFDQIILLGENAFLKKMLEDGLDAGVSWKDLNMHVIFGGDSFPESYRLYIEKLLGLPNPQKPDALVATSFGFAEIGLNVMGETRNSIALRKRVCTDRSFRMALLGEDFALCPVLLQYNPMSIFVEELDGKLLFTNLKRNPYLPIIRYATGDEGFIISSDKVAKVLDDFGLKQLMPDYGLPLVALKCREEHLEHNGQKVYPDMIKDALYSGSDLAGSVTGCFRIKRSRGAISADIQLKPGVKPGWHLNKKFSAALKKSVKAAIKPHLYAYSSFPYAMELDYERKFRYV